LWCGDFGFGRRCIPFFLTEGRRGEKRDEQDNRDLTQEFEPPEHDAEAAS
jgi:hypothetical protein